MLDAYDIEIKEIEVSEAVIDRVDAASLSRSDIETIDSSREMAPSRWPDYIFEEHWYQRKEDTLWRSFPLVIPLGLIDSRIVDLAKSFWDAPDQRLLSGYRRFEDILRARTKIEEHSYKLISCAFAPGKGPLGWVGVDGERLRAGSKS